ncbi:hypothetical protein QZH41_002973 [Actinostola sp. cb2023]|nr:hypothetical protein QZH41_002973 [Actinostola sp. cb2023]
MDADKSNLTLESIYKVVTEIQSNTNRLLTENKSLRIEFDEVRTAMTFQSKLVEDLVKENKSTKKDFTDLTNSLSDCNAELRNANTKIEWLETKIDDLEAQSRKYNIEIHGIPQTEDEDLEETTIKVAESVGVVLDEDDIDIVHRLYSKAQIKPILVKFKSHKTKNELYQARRKLRDVKASETFNGAVAVYINENLTAFRRRLYGEVLKSHFSTKSCLRVLNFGKEIGENVSKARKKMPCLGVTQSLALTIRYPFNKPSQSLRMTVIPVTESG